MSSADTNAVRFSVSNDVCEHANGLDQWLDNRYHQLEKKAKFHGRLCDIQLDKRLRVTREVIDTPLVEQIGYVPSDKIMLINIQGDSDILINGRYVNSGSFHVSSGKPIHAISKSMICAYIVTLDRDFFLEHITEGAKIKSLKGVFETFITPSHGSVLDFQKTVLQNFVDSPSGEVCQASTKRLLGSIQEIALSEADGVLQVLPPSTRAFIVDRSCELLFDNFSNEEFGVLEMCNYLKVSRRTLQYSFESVMGMSPSNYVRTVRLNVARKLMLLSPHDKIQGAALDAGFSHLGRFSKYYQDFFGELPSQTVGRVANRVPH
ncbi:AraC family transcriptional regulator [Pseudomonas sp. CMR5c]|uniref:AraC family transcriptional regulator n=1 Tax=Pseudomonas sp. CMR5c TaxID=658630 RepID=UPI00069F8102|nr:AraC family transcriptional regulator [Pseudomonas sp. CMR5c]AZC17899.1 Ethanolamine operon regulatory protein [Pseudomonas sp. CMR5c]